MLPDGSGIPAIPGRCGKKSNDSTMPSRASQCIRCIPLDEWRRGRNRQHHVQVTNLQTCSHVLGGHLEKGLAKKGLSMTFGFTSARLHLVHEQSSKQKSMH